MFFGILLALMTAFFVAVWILLASPGMRCDKPDCYGKMERLGSAELDEYLESASPTPEDTMMVPAVPDVYRCLTCGYVVEKRG